MELNAKDVMKLRNDTGLPMMACKAALIEAQGDIEKATDLLRKQLKGKMDTKTDRASGEGRVAISITREAAAIVELRTETDFTAKNEKFVTAAAKIADLALGAHAGDVPQSPDILAVVDDLRISTGENVRFARGHKITQDPGSGSIGHYVHHDGKTGVLVQAEGSVSDETLRQVCMHITAAVPRPKGITADDIPSDVVEKERRFRIDAAMESGKPKEIAEKMVEGGMRKFFEEVALLEQPFIMDPTKKVKDILGANVRVVGFYRWQVGEQA
ncbi:MAG: translation elongation factor Ts [Phycisphaeraceae bacterium]|nr:translation elongation factor Ts [Phycisphaeraceae bacterium]MBX3410023.1 translation elongation factor Ts [Phycisphaeraceae bacterium]